MRSTASAPSNKYEKRPKFFEGKSRPCITAANVSCARLNVVVAFVVRSFVHALSWSVTRIPPTLLHFAVVVKVFLPDICLLQLPFFQLASFPPITSAAVSVETGREVMVVPGVQRPLLLAH